MTTTRNARLTLTAGLLGLVAAFLLPLTASAQYGEPIPPTVVPTVITQPAPAPSVSQSQALPVTGSDVVGLTLVAGAVVAVGMGLAISARRKRFAADS